MLPGGNLEDGETEEEAIKRELKDETNLDVKEIEILFDQPSHGKDIYQRYVTLPCVPIPASVESIGSETVSFRKILELVWVSLSNEKQWNDYKLKEQFFPSMNRIKNRLMNGLGTII